MAFPDYPSKDSFVSKRHATSVCYFIHLLNPGEFRENGSTMQQPGNAIRGSSTTAVTPLRQCCDRDIGSWGSKARAPAYPRSPVARAAPAGMEGRKKLAAKSGLIPAWRFSKDLQLHLLCTDPWEDREDGEEAYLTPSSFSARLQILTPANISPGPGNLFLLISLLEISSLFWM